MYLRWWQSRRVHGINIRGAVIWGLCLGVALCLDARPATSQQKPAAGTAAVKPVPASTAPATDAIALDRKIMAAATTNSEIMKNLTYLSDIIGPRLTGSSALKRANEWAASKLLGYGLKNVRLEAWSIPAGWERGPASARIIEPDNGRSFPLAAMGWTPGLKGKVEGSVIILPSRNPKELAAFKGKLKNAIVIHGPPATVRPISDRSAPGLWSDGRPSGRRGGGTPAPAQGGTATKAAPSQTRPEGFSRAREMATSRREFTDFLVAEGAAAVLIDAAKPHGLLATTGSWQGSDRASAIASMPSLFVAHEHYALLHRLATQRTPGKTRVEIEVSNTIVPGPLAVYNTVGEIRGKEKPDEYVVIGAHLDSWDLAQGTIDNGTGSSIVLETARILAQCGTVPKRTIRFVLFTGEEQGLHGSRAYVEQHKDEMAKTSLCLVHDTGTGKVTGIGLQGRVAIKPILEAELASLKELGLTNIDLRSMGGSDHMSFERAGVPGFAVQQDMTEYFLSHHSQSDTLDKAREPDLIQGAQVMAVAAMRIANLPTLLPRDKK